MDIKVLTNVPTTDGENEYYTIGTHNGIFHCDEVVAVALLSFFHSDKKIIIVKGD